MKRSARRSPVGFARCALLVMSGLCAVSSCDRGQALGAHDVEELADRHPQITAMFDASRASLPARIEGGFRITATPSAADILPAGWKTPVTGVQVDVDDHGDLRIQTPRASVTAARIGGAARPQVAREGSTVVVRDAAGIRSVLMARATGVEDLLVQADAASAGYDLELPLGWSLAAPAGHPGLVEIRDGHAHLRLRIVAPVAWDAAGAAWPVTAQVAGRQVRFQVHAATARPSDAAVAPAPGPLVVDPEWQDAASPASVRLRASAAQLPDGRVLVVGGATSSTSELLCSSEIYDPAQGTWEAGPSIPAAGEGLPADACTTVSDTVSVPLHDGSILFVGGASRVNPDGSSHVVGADQAGAIALAWRYHPATGTFDPTGPMLHPRVHHTATLLPSGQVLIAGGSDRQKPTSDDAAGCSAVGDTACEHCVGLASAELYDPDAGTFEPVPMTQPRSCHSAHLLADGSVLLIAGGGAPVLNQNLLWGTPLTALSLYKDGAITELATSLNSPRLGHISVLDPERNQILVSLGRNEKQPLSGRINPQTQQPVYALSEIIDLDLIQSASPPEKTTPVPCVFVDEDGGAGGAGGDGPAGPPCPVGRSYAAATLSHDGRAILVGGLEVPGGTEKSPFSRAVDEYDFESQSYKTSLLPSPALRPVLTTLVNGQTLLLGQTVPPRLYDTDRWAFTGEAASMVTPRSWHSVTPLPGGSLLVAGGQYWSTSKLGYQQLATAEVFDPATMTSKLLPSQLGVARSAHTATYLPAAGGRAPAVLIAGGVSRTGGAPEVENFLASNAADLYDPATQTFQTVGPMTRTRAYHTATLLPDGRVLVVGGTEDHFVIAPSAEIYDPATRQFEEIQAPGVGRWYQTATLLPSSGNVLLAGGFTLVQEISPNGPTTAAEIFESATSTFRRAADMVAPRGAHVAQLLPDGNVLLAGGSSISTNAELFDPETEQFRPASGAMNAGRLFASATMLPSGKVLIAGGALLPSFFEPWADAEVYDPTTETFEPVPPGDETPPREDHRAALLPDGSVGLFGGSSAFDDHGMTKRVDILRIVSGQAGPLATLGSAPSAVSPGQPQPISGADLASSWEISSGQYPSSTNFPTALWIPAVGVPVIGNLLDWSDTEATWMPRSTPFHGLGLLFAVRHGRASAEAVAVELAPAEPGVACDADAACASGFCSDGVCCNERCHVAGDGDSTCRACSVAKGAAADGTCSNVAENTDPQLDCEASLQCAENSATCDGAGHCKPCRCSSKVDCAVGYTCTASGTCERPPVPVPEDGCAFVPPRQGSGVPWWFLVGLVGLAGSRWTRRRPGRRTHRAAGQL